MSEKAAGKTAERAPRRPAGNPAVTGRAGSAGADKGNPQAPAKDAPKLDPEPLVVLPGFEQVAPAWWAAVSQVYDALLDENSDLETVSTAFHEELVTRFHYAKALHERGYQVPDYLAERSPISPQWPLPEVPKLARRATRAA